MKNIKISLLSSILMVSIVYSASHDAETSARVRDLLTEIIKKRSLDSFKEQQSHVQQLTYDDISTLKGVCAAYADALCIIREMRENPAIENEMHKMRREDDATCLQFISNLFPNHARQRAIQIVEGSYGTPLGNAFKSLALEYAYLANEQLYEKVSRRAVI